MFGFQVNSGTVLKDAGSGDSSDGIKSVNLDSGILFPGDNIFGHSIELDISGVHRFHLKINRILVVDIDEVTGKVDGGHGVVFGVVTGVDTNNSEVRVEDIFSVAS